ncbi:hypothetical protein X975_14846, partial [Stegodyphus mimosarum]
FRPHVNTSYCANFLFWINQCGNQICCNISFVNNI